MLTMIKFILAIAIIISPQLIYAQKSEDRIFTKLLNAKSLQCSFIKGYSGVWESGGLDISKGEMPPLIFDSVNLKTSTARLIGNVGGTDVSVTATLKGLTFIEQTTTGNLNFTTVYGDIADDGDFITVHSRHLSIFGQPYSSQFHGTCKIIDSKG